MWNQKIEFFKKDIINLDITHRCTLECPQCQRSYLKSKGKTVPGYDMPMKHYLLILNYFKEIDFCGQSSDPIFHPNFIQFLKLAYEKNVKVNIHTAASQKSKEWYKEAFESNKNAKWIFGIDGLPNVSHIHRINQDGQKLFEMMMLAKDIVKTVQWQFIVFEYNEHQIENAKEIAKENNIEFKLMISSRFAKDDPLKPTRKDLFIPRDWKQWPKKK